MSALLVSEVSNGGIIGEIPPLHQPKSNLRGDAYLLIARTIQGRFWSDGRQPFLYPIREELLVIPTVRTARSCNRVRDSHRARPSCGLTSLRISRIEDFISMACFMRSRRVQSSQTGSWKFGLEWAFLRRDIENFAPAQHRRAAGASSCGLGLFRWTARNFERAAGAGQGYYASNRL